VAFFSTSFAKKAPRCFVCALLVPLLGTEHTQARDFPQQSTAVASSLRRRRNSIFSEAKRRNDKGVNRNTASRKRPGMNEPIAPESIVKRFQCPTRQRKRQHTTGTSRLRWRAGIGSEARGRSQGACGGKGTQPRTDAFHRLPIGSGWNPTPSCCRCRGIPATERRNSSQHRFSNPGQCLSPKKHPPECLPVSNCPFRQR